MLTRFLLGKALSVFVFLIMLGTLGHAIHAVEQPSATSVESGFGENDGLIFGSLFLTRLSFLLLYIIIMLRLPLTRPMLLKYVAVFLATTLLFLTAAVCNDSTTAFVLWIVASVFELLMYPLALLTPHEFQLTVNTAHLLERNQLWVILILGESIISIASAQHARNAEYYVVVVAAFLLIYWLMKFHLKSQHLVDERAEEHALDHSPFLAFMFDTLHLIITSGMLIMAVGVKLAISYASQPEKYTRDHAWTLTVPLGITLFTMNISSLLHRTRPLLFCGRTAGRFRIMLVEALLSLTVIPLALFVDPNEGASKKKTRRDIDAVTRPLAQAAADALQATTPFGDLNVGGAAGGGDAISDDDSSMSFASAPNSTNGNSTYPPDSDYGHVSHMLEPVSLVPIVTREREGGEREKGIEGGEGAERAEEGEGEGGAQGEEGAEGGEGEQETRTKQQEQEKQEEQK